MAAAHPPCAKYYEIDWELLPNLMMDLVVPQIARFVNVYLASQLFTIATFVLIMSGTFALNRALFKRWSVLPLIAFPLLYNYVFLARCDELLFRNRPGALGPCRLGGPAPTPVARPLRDFRALRRGSVFLPPFFARCLRPWTSWPLKSGSPFRSSVRAFWSGHVRSSVARASPSCPSLRSADRQFDMEPCAGLEVEFLGKIDGLDLCGRNLF